jgi:hypothetical protein
MKQPPFEHNMNDNLQNLTDYAKTNGRVCPQPMKWNELWEILPDRKRTNGYEWEPAVPLILGAWWGASVPAKRSRFQEHLIWAESKGVLDKVRVFLENLSENEWFHENE